MAQLIESRQQGTELAVREDTEVQYVRLTTISVETLSVTSWVQHRIHAALMQVSMVNLGR